MKYSAIFCIMSCVFMPLRFFFHFFQATKIGDFFRIAKRKTFFNLEKSAPVTGGMWRVRSASPTLMKFPQFKLFIHSLYRITVFTVINPFLADKQLMLTLIGSPSFQSSCYIVVSIQASLLTVPFEGTCHLMVFAFRYADRQCQLHGIVFPVKDKGDRTLTAHLRTEEEG